MFLEIATYCAVVEASSFAKAARVLKISTPVVTKRVAKLERELGSKLLQRTTRQLAVTETGRVFYEQGIALLQSLDSAKKQVKQVRDEVSGVIKVGIPLSISCLYVTQNLHLFTRRYPQVKLQIVHGNHLLDLLREGFDIVVHCGDLPDSSFHYKTLGTWRKIICAAPSYLKKFGTPKKPQELLQHNCIDHYDNYIKAWRFNINNKITDITINGNVMVNGSLDLKNLAVHGLGIVYLPSFVVQKELRDGKLISILDKYQPPLLSLSAVYPSAQFLSKKVKVFLDFLQELKMGD